MAVPLQQEALDGLPDYPGVRAADPELEAARAGVRESWSAFLPDLELQYYRQDFGGGWNDYGFQLGFSVPLWAPLNDRGRIQGGPGPGAGAVLVAGGDPSGPQA